MKQGEVYKCRIKLRTTFKGNELKPETIALDGVILNLQVLWKCDSDELYANEYALGPPHDSNLEDDDLMNIGNISWIASGDIEIINKIS